MLKNYLKIAWKVLGRNKFFTFVSLFGISFTLAILIVVSALLNDIIGPSYPDWNRSRSIYINRVTLENKKNGSMSSSAASFHLLNNYVKKLKTPEKVAIVSNAFQTNTFVGNKKLNLAVKFSDATFWEVYNFDFLAGKPYNEKNISDNDYVAVITESTKEAYFGDEPNVIGKTLTTDNVNYQVIGVVKDVPEYQNVAGADIFLPYNTTKMNLEDKGFLGAFTGVLLARDADDISAIKAEFKQMQASIPLPADRWYDEWEAKAYTQLETLAQVFSNRREDPSVALLLGLLGGAMLLFMLLPTLNLINLNTSRIMERASEIGVRKAFGATSATLAIQFIIENIILTFIGGAIGLVMAFVLLQAIERSDIFPHAILDINFKVFFAAILICIFFGILSGVLPAIRMSKMQVVHAIKGV